MIRSAALYGFADLVRSSGGNVAQLLEEAGIPAEACDQLDLKIPVAAYYRLFNLASARIENVTIGIRLAQVRRLSLLGPLGLYAREQLTVRRFLGILLRYIWVHNEAVCALLSETSHAVTISIVLLRDRVSPTRDNVEVALGALCQYLRSVIAPHWQPAAVTFQHPAPADLSVHRRVFGKNPSFDHKMNSLVVSPQDLDRVIGAADAIMESYIADYFEGLIGERERRFGEDVRKLILQLLPTRLQTAERVAAILGITRRTLHRRLAEEGCTFSDLVNEARRDVVHELVAAGRPFRAVAELSGFATPSAFSQWFKRNFGRSPRHFRAKAAT